MAPKSIPDKTKRYEGVVNNVKKTTVPPEPRIAPHQVVQAFRSFGYEPNQNKMNDVGYWTTRPQSEGPKLMAELRDRRKADNDKVESVRKDSEAKSLKDRQEAEARSTQARNIAEQHAKDTATAPRMSDHDIKKLYDEYGLPTPHPEWARNNLPNDPKKVRSILEVQRKMTDEMMKKHLKNTVNSMPEIPKQSAATSSAMLPPNNNNNAPGHGGPGYGMGGPGQPAAQPFFIGNHAVVRIANPNNPNSSTLWLVDSKKKVLRPFTSDKAFQNAFEDPDAAANSVVNLSSQDLGPNGPLAGFKPLNAEQGVQEDGTMSNLQTSPAQLQKHYGKAQNTALEQRSLALLDGALSKIGPGGSQPPMPQQPQQ